MVVKHYNVPGQDRYRYLEIVKDCWCSCLIAVGSMMSHMLSLPGSDFTHDNFSIPAYSMEWKNSEINTWGNNFPIHKRSAKVKNCL
jgi:hypothetical protein